MSHHIVVLALWMTTSYQAVTTSSSSLTAVDTLLTSANSLLAKIIKPPSSTGSSTKSAKPKPSPLKTTATPFRLDIPIYEQLASAEATWKMHHQHQHQQSSSNPMANGYWANHPYIHSYHHPQVSPSYSPGSLPPLLDYHYQSPVWSAALFGSYITNNDQQFPAGSSGLINDQNHLSSQQWPSTSLAASPSYQYPLFMTPSGNSPSPTDATSNFLFGKSPTSSDHHHSHYHRPYNSQDHIYFPSLDEDVKLKPGELPLSLVAAEMLAEAATSSSPSPSSSSSRTPESNFFDSQLFDHTQNFHPSSTSANSFNNLFADQSDPFAETRTFERFQQHQQQQNDQNHYFGGSGNSESPSSLNSLLLNEQLPPYYLEDTFNNFASLLQQRPQTVIRPPLSSTPVTPRVAPAATGNWPHHSRYEADDRQKRSHLYNNGSSIISLRRSNDTAANLMRKAMMNSPPPGLMRINCSTTTTTTTTRRPHRHPTFGFDFSEAPFRPMLPSSSAGHQPPHFEALRRRSGLVLDQQAAAASSIVPQNDRLLTATSINSHTRVKLNNVEGDEDEVSSNKDSSSGDTEDAGAEYDRSKGDETESAVDGESEDSARSTAEDDGSNGPNHDRERLQYLKDKGYAKHGWKNIYHKEEWGEQKKYHDIWRFKDWKDRFADKSPAASQPRPSIVSAPSSVKAVNSTTVPQTIARQK